MIKTLLILLPSVILFTGCMSTEQTIHTHVHDNTPEVIETLRNAGYTKQETVLILIELKDKKQPSIFLNQIMKDNNKKYKAHKFPVEIPLIN